MSGPARTRRSAIRDNPLYDSGVAKVTAFAAALIVVSIVVTGVIAYYITKGQSVKKLKESDLVYIASSISAKIDGSIERAVETSLILAEDRQVKQWIADGERSGEQRSQVLDKIVGLKERFGYDNSFVVSVPTGQYWSEAGNVIDVVSPNDPDDDWFYEVLRENNPIKVMIDYNDERKDTFVFVDAIMRSGGNPLAIVGVGLSLRDLSRKFEEYKYGRNGSLWLIDRSGTIYLSDEFDQNGKTIREFMPAEAADRAIALLDRDQQVLEYESADGKTNDAILFPIRSTDWHLMVSVDREEAVSFLKTIQAQTAAAVAISLLSIVFFFYYMSRKLADPYKRAVALNEELERQIAERTKELAEQNGKIVDSLDYASRIQVSSLPAEAELMSALPDHFVLWKPRDRVGGDFYWIKRIDGGLLVAVGDCTGHGVPGALMSIMTVSLLDQIAERGTADDPAGLLSALNRTIKTTLNQEGKDGLTDDGLDIGLCRIKDGRVLFAGAGCSLYVRTPDGVTEVEGTRKAIGYRKTPADYPFVHTELTPGPDDGLFLATDGLADQNGGDKGYSFGKTRWKAWIERYGDRPMAEQRELLEAELARYRGDEPQRDDVTVLGFRLPGR
ncbi:SpoIIE family protein phosphatase [Paenibacillus flagellatus]|uniref:SpoIIE family protein phosphatase n=1 Tax=Paenibacillus flagellatus TaxID=2211139 RepID=UPI00130507A0|nr:SpoIIE family protein phosphatase [Paenibacillus flagellatus]